MRECLSIHIGQAGVNMGDACWKQYCMEHGIKPDGSMETDGGVEQEGGQKNDEQHVDTFFTQTGELNKPCFQILTQN